MFVLIELITWIFHFKTIEKPAMERMTRSDEQPLEPESRIVAPTVPRQFDDVISGTRGVVLIGIDQPWVACVEGTWI